MIKRFGSNLKKYCDYLMTIHFGELFINVLVLACILLLSTFVFVPVGLVQNVIRDFILLFGNISNIFLSIYDFMFNIISTVLAAGAFVYMFNKRFEDLDLFKRQMFNVDSGQKKEIIVEEEILELPKEKDKSKMK